MLKKGGCPGPGHQGDVDRLSPGWSPRSWAAGAKHLEGPPGGGGSGGDAKGRGAALPPGRAKGWRGNSRPDYGPRRLVPGGGRADVPGSAAGNDIQTRRVGLGSGQGDGREWGECERRMWLRSAGLGRPGAGTRSERRGGASGTLLTPLEELRHILVAAQRRVAALGVEAHQHVQQRLHAQGTLIAPRPVQEQLLQLLEPHLGRHGAARPAPHAPASRRPCAPASGPALPGPVAARPGVQ